MVKTAFEWARRCRRKLYSFAFGLALGSGALIAGSGQSCITSGQ
jgi:F0F1-type ATP synthase membrane subunit c/vacuolar-type H+-ATPase subunit K